jgi:alanine racemase
MRLSTHLMVDLNLLTKNVHSLQEYAPHAKILFMIKSNAYGHGVGPLVDFCINKLGIHEFGVAALGEGLSLRQSLPFRDYDIYVFSDLNIQTKHDFSSYTENRLLPVLSSLRLVRLYVDYIKDHAVFLPCVLKFDTGMNRLGIKEEEMEELCSLLSTLTLKSLYHVMTHFACSSYQMELDLLSQKQIQCFSRIKKRLQKQFSLEKTSMSNSGAILQKVGIEETHVRPGLMLYGPSPLNKDIRSQFPWKGHLISSLQVIVIEKKKVKKDELVGYNAVICPSMGWLVYLSVGYGDGFDNRLSGMSIRLKNEEGFILGRVSMDMMAVFFTQANLSINVGDSFFLWDHQGNELEMMTDYLKTIPYEILCGLSERVPRKYHYSSEKN